MENESTICGFCSLPYDAEQHTPFVLFCCGHTLCSSCLNKIIKNPNLRKCPFDNGVFYEWQNSLDHFPINFALLALIQRRNQTICPVHSEELSIFCLQDGVKICRDCALFGGHKWHPMKQITEMRAQGMKTKKDLEESQVIFEKIRLEEEQRRKEFLAKMKKRFEEIKRIMSVKESEWTKKMDDLFRRSDNNWRSLKKEAFKAIKEINLTNLNQDFSSIISKLEPQVTNISKFSGEASRIMDSLESFLIDQTNSIKNFDFFSGKVKEISSEDLMKATQNFPRIQVETLLTLNMQGESLFICIKHPNLTNQRVDLGELNKAKRVKIKLERYHFLLPDSTDLNFLSSILQKLDNYTSLVVVFTPFGLNDHHAINLFENLFCRAQHLTEIDISFGYGFFGEYKITDEAIEFFCNDILPKASSLAKLALKLGSTLITDKSLFALAKSLSPLSKNLESFTLGVGKTAVTDDGIQKIFQNLLGVKVLDLYLKGTGITDRSLKALGENVLPFMRNLERFSLDAGETKITIEGVTGIFNGVPGRIKWLSLDFSQVKLPDLVVSVFEEKVGPKLNSVDGVYLRLEGKDLEEKVAKVLETIRKNADAEKNKETAKQENTCR